MPLSVQAPHAVVMIRPHHFTPNPETAADNGFQSIDSARTAAAIARAAYDEVSCAAERLEAVGVTVHLFDDEENGRPDSVFPNNWFSTHMGGHVAVFPMYSPNRRRERRWDVIEMLKARYRVQTVIDYSGLERDNAYLEGTGAMVLDHGERVAYTVRSNRADPVVLERFCTHFNFEPVMFDAADEAGRAIYHTNVLMCVGTAFCLIAPDAIVDADRRRGVCERLAANGRTVIGLSMAQIGAFAGNALELRGRDGPVLALSSRAMAALSAEQVEAISRFSTLLPLDIPTIELAGGSARCMLAGVHLSPRADDQPRSAAEIPARPPSSSSAVGHP